MTRPQPGFLRRNGLGLVLLVMFAASMVGQVASGHLEYNRELLQQGSIPLSLWAYLKTGHLASAIFENWESEFLQMTVYIVLTVKLRQWGSAESRPLAPGHEEPRIDEGPTPWPARRGGRWRALYGQSLAIAFGLLFLASFVLHLLGSWRDALAERRLAGEPDISLWVYLGESRFWFESFQNWQSEFLAVLALVWLTIWLRQKDSPQSKAIDAPHAQTGN